jgi:Pyridoxamine 5'-phosphate oxidase
MRRYLVAKLYDHITDHLVEFICAQPMFFVATAPLAADGHVNVSPKGLDCLRILSPQRVAYLDMTGSGNETSAHILENGRITFMFCAFNRPPTILRLYGQGHTILPGSDEWAQLVALFPDYHGARQIIAADIDRVQTSCGYAVPLMDYVGQRDTLLRWAKSKDEQGLDEYRCENNTRSVDGLPTPWAKRVSTSQAQDS